MSSFSILSFLSGGKACSWYFGFTNCRPGIAKAIEEFKLSVYGEDYNEENDEAAEHGKTTNASRKRKAASEDVVKEYAKYNWLELADSGKVSYSHLK